MAPLDKLLDLLHEPRSSRELQRQLGLSQASISRLLRRAGAQVVRLGRGPATRYVRAVPALGGAPSLPLHAVDRAGLVEQIATLTTLANGSYLVQADPPLFWLLGHDGTGLFDSLPYFLHDLRPAGFLGRLIARELAAAWGIPADPRQWNDEQIGRFLLERGHDLPGNLVLGRTAAQRVNLAEIAPVTDRHAEYPRLAQRALAGEAPGSSAAGEQPKLAVTHRDAGPVIVKFSPAGETAEAVRWRDLLRAEHHALACLAARGIPAAESSLHEIDGRCFLESRRFDRHGERGRSPAISLAMIDAEYVGVGHGWSRAARGLAERGLLDKMDLERVAWLECFGGWIGNTDMHLGNLSLAPAAERFELLPVYDMLPMALAPARGEVRQVNLRPPIRTGADRKPWRSAGAAAADFWSTVADDHAVSDGFRRLAADQARTWRQLLGL